MVRNDLGLGEKGVSEADVRSVWVSIDANANGHISQGEFVRFFRKGERQAADANPAPSWRARAREKAKAAANLTRAERVRARAHHAIARTGEEAGGQWDDSAALPAPSFLASPTRTARAARDALAPPRAPQVDHNNLKASLKQAPVASEEQVVALATLCHACAAQLDDAALQTRSRPGGMWCNLFRSIDTDESGQISFSEFVSLVRNDLGLGKKGVSEADVRSVWVSIDANANGHISQGEFVRFFRKGERQAADANPAPSWRERAHEKAKAKAKLTRAERDALYDKRLSRELEGAPAASREEVARLSSHFNRRLVELHEQRAEEAAHGGGGGGAAAAAAAASRWYTLFKMVDENESGLISYGELQTMVRSELGLPPSNVPESILRATFVALDTDGSGLISAGEFGRFMRIGAPAARAERGATLARRQQLGQRERASYEASIVRRKRSQLAEMDARSRAIEQRARTLEAELARARDPDADDAADSVAARSPDPARGGGAFELTRGGEVSPRVEPASRVRPGGGGEERRQVMQRVNGGAPRGVPSASRHAPVPLPSDALLKRLGARGREQLETESARNALAAYASMPTLPPAARGAKVQARAAAGGGLRGSASEGALLKLPAL